jgi:hypothetical protein
MYALSGVILQEGVLTRLVCRCGEKKMFFFMTNKIAGFGHLNFLFLVLYLE